MAAELSQWRRSIGDLLAATERNLLDVDGMDTAEGVFGDRAARANKPPLTAFPRPSAVYNDAAPPPPHTHHDVAADRRGYANTHRAPERDSHDPRVPLAVIERPLDAHGGRVGGGRDIPVMPTASDGLRQRGGDGGVYIDVALAYKVDNLTLSVAVLQKDFDLLKAQRAAREEEAVKLAVETEETASAMKANFAKLERRVAERLNHVDDMALEAYNSVYSRTPGVGVREAALAPPPAPLEEHNKLKAKVEYLERLVLEQEKRPRVEELVQRAVEEALETRVDDLSREAGQVARKAAASEVKNRFDYVENELAAAMTAQEGRIRSEWGKAMSEFKGQQQQAMEATVAQAVDSVAALKSQTTSLCSWRDVMETRVYKAEEERNQQLTRLKSQADEALHELRRTVDKQFEASDERVRRKIDEARIGLVDDERLCTMLAPMKNDIQTNLDLIAQHKTQQEGVRQTWEERLKRQAADLAATIAAASSELTTQLSAVKDDVLNTHQELSARLAALKTELLDRVRAADDMLRSTEDAMLKRQDERASTYEAQLKRVAQDMQTGHRQHAEVLDGLRNELQKLDDAASAEARAATTFRDWAKGELTGLPAWKEGAQREIDALEALQLGGFKEWASGEVKGIRNAIEEIKSDVQTLEASRDAHDAKWRRAAKATAAAAAVADDENAPAAAAPAPPTAAARPPLPTQPSGHAATAYQSDTDRDGAAGWSSGYETGGTAFTDRAGMPIHELRAIAEECRALRSQAVSAVVQQAVGGMSPRHAAAAATTATTTAPTATATTTTTATTLGGTAAAILAGGGGGVGEASHADAHPRVAGVPPVGAGGSVLAAARSALQSAARLGIDVTSGGMEPDDLVPYQCSPGGLVGEGMDLSAHGHMSVAMPPSSPTLTREVIERFKATREECVLPPHLATLPLPLSDSEDADLVAGGVHDDSDDDLAVDGDTTQQRTRRDASSEYTKKSNWSSWKDFTPTSVTSQRDEEDYSLLQGLDLEGGSSNT